MNYLLMIDDELFMNVKVCYLGLGGDKLEFLGLAILASSILREVVFIKEVFLLDVVLLALSLVLQDLHFLHSQVRQKQASKS